MFALGGRGGDEVEEEDEGIAADMRKFDSKINAICSCV